MPLLGRKVRLALSRLGIVRPPAEATLVSFPKSGRTWLRVMLDKANLPVHYIHAGSSYARSAHHNELQVEGAEILGSATLFLHRDPRDTVVSGYFQKTLRIGSGCEMSIADFIRDPHLGLEKVVIFNLALLEQGARYPNFASVSYEELRADPVRGLGLVLRHIQPSSDFESAEVERIVEESTFQKMRDNERKGIFARRYGEALTPANADNPDSFKVRRGKIGGYVDYFSPEDIRWSDDLLARHDYFRRVADASRKTGLLHRQA